MGRLHGEAVDEDAQRTSVLYVQKQKNTPKDDIHGCGPEHEVMSLMEKYVEGDEYLNPQQRRTLMHHST